MVCKRPYFILIPTYAMALCFYVIIFFTGQKTKLYLFTLKIQA